MPGINPERQIRNQGYPIRNAVMLHQCGMAYLCIVPGNPLGAPSNYHPERSRGI